MTTYGRCISARVSSLRVRGSVGGDKPAATIQKNIECILTRMENEISADVRPEFFWSTHPEVDLTHLSCKCSTTRLIVGPSKNGSNGVNAVTDSQYPGSTQLNPKTQDVPNPGVFLTHFKKLALDAGFTCAPPDLRRAGMDTLVRQDVVVSERDPGRGGHVR